MDNKIIIINGPNLNLLGEREQSQYGSITFEDLKKNCQNKAKEIGINLEFTQSNIEGEIVTLIQDLLLELESTKTCLNALRQSNYQELIL